METKDYWFLLGGILLVYMGYRLIIRGRAAFRNDEARIGKWDPKLYLFRGIVMFVGGVVFLVKFLFLLFEGN